MNTLISILLAILNNPVTDNTSREITRQILIHYRDFPALKAQELAEYSFCNTSTINRYCKNLGFRSFNELKTYLSTNHDIRRAQIAHHMEIVDEEKLLANIAYLIGPSFDRDEFIAECEKLNRMIDEAPRIVIIGAVFPEAITLHYQEDMIELGKCFYTAPVVRRLELPNEDSSAMIVMISFTGRLIDYCRNEFDELQDRFSRTVVMTGRDSFPAGTDQHMIFHLPFAGDDEASNTAFVEIMRYLKYRYYIDYVSKQ